GGIVINPVWSRDGTRLFYERGGDSVQMLDHSSGKSSEIYKAPKKCLDGELTNFNSAPSPDGNSVAIQDCSSLYVVGVATGERRKVLELQEPDRFLFPGSLAWTQDGKWLLFGRFGGKSAELCRVSAQGGVPESTGLLLDNKYIYFLRV